MPVRMLRGAAIALSVLFLASLARAADDPFQPLTSVAKRLDEGVAAFLAGKSAEEAYAPWKASVAPETTATLRTEMKKAGVASARSFYAEFELHYVAEKKAVYRVRASLWMTPESVTLIDLSAEKQDGDAPPSAAFPAGTASEPLQPFAKVAKALDAALKGEGWKDAPVADPEKVKTALAGALPEKDLAEARETIGKIRATLERAATEVKALQADGLLVHVDDQGYLALDAAGKVVGMIGGEFEVADDGALAYHLQRFRTTGGD